MKNYLFILIILLLIFPLSLNAENYLDEVSAIYENDFHLKIINSETPQDLRNEYEVILQKKLINDKYKEITIYLLNLLHGEIRPGKVILEDGVRDSSILFILSYFELLRDEKTNSRELFYWGKLFNYANGKKYDIESSKFFLNLGRNIEKHEILLDYSNELYPDARIPLLKGINELRDRKIVNSLSLFYDFFRQLENTEYNSFLLLSFLFVLVSIILVINVFIIERFFLWRKMILHESRETSESPVFISIDSFAKLKMKKLCDSVYILTSILIFMLFILLLNTSGPAGKLKTSLNIVKYYKTFREYNNIIEEKLENNDVSQGLYEYLNILEYYKKGENSKCMDEIEKISVSSAFYEPSLYYKACILYNEKRYSESLKLFYSMAHEDDIPEAWFGVYLSAVKTEDKAYSDTAKSKLDSTLSGKNLYKEQLYFSNTYGERFRFPLFIEEKEIIDIYNYFPDLFNFFILIMGIITGLFCLIMIRIFFSGNISLLKTKICAECGMISCENCRVTLELCPNCFADLPESIDEINLIKHNIKRDGPPSLLLSTFLFGYSQFMCKFMVKTGVFLSFVNYSLFLIFYILIPCYFSGLPEFLNNEKNYLRGYIFRIFILFYVLQFLLGIAGILKSRWSASEE